MALKRQLSLKYEIIFTELSSLVETVCVPSLPRMQTEHTNYSSTRSTSDEVVQYFQGNYLLSDYVVNDVQYNSNDVFSAVQTQIYILLM